MPPADDTALARSQGNSSSAFLIVFVVVPGDGAAAFDCSDPAHTVKSLACLGFAFHVKPAGLQERIRFTILGFDL